MFVPLVYHKMSPIAPDCQEIDIARFPRLPKLSNQCFSGSKDVFTFLVKILQSKARINLVSNLELSKGPLRISIGRVMGPIKTMGRVLVLLR